MMSAALVKKCKMKQTFCVTGKDIIKSEGNVLHKNFYSKEYLFSQSTKMKTKREMK